MENLEQAVQRGNEARQILVSPIFLEAKEALKERYLKELLGSSANESAVRETAYLKIRVLNEVINELGIVEQRGAKAASDVKVRERRAKS